MLLTGRIRTLPLIPQISDSLLSGMAFHDAHLFGRGWWAVAALDLLHLYINVIIALFVLILNRLGKPGIFFSNQQVLPLCSRLRLENYRWRFHLRPVVEAQEHVLLEFFVFLWLVSVAGFNDDLERLHISTLVLFQISIDPEVGLGSLLIFLTLVEAWITESETHLGLVFWCQAHVIFLVDLLLRFTWKYRLNSGLQFLLSSLIKLWFIFLASHGWSLMSTRLVLFLIAQLSFANFDCVALSLNRGVAFVRRARLEGCLIARTVKVGVLIVV